MGPVKSWGWEVIVGPTASTRSVAGSEIAVEPEASVTLQRNCMPLRAAVTPICMVGVS